MDSKLIKNMSLGLNKSSWVLTKLGNLAKDISKRVENPGESEYDRFVGLGNFVSGDIRIKSWETTENLASSAKAFQTGDILFARRNAYLRRASLVDFDGCCSGDAFVLRENHDEVVPGFLAFLMNSNKLWDFANSNAAGTMSKRVKWRDLAEYEFLLPPKQEQSKIDKLFSGMKDTIENDYILLSSLKKLYQVKIEQSVPRYVNQYWKLGDIITTRRGVTYKSTDYSDKEQGIPLLNLKTIERGGGFNKEGVKYFKGACNDSHFVKNSDLIIACTDITRQGHVVGFPLHPLVYQNKKMLFTMDLVAIEVDESKLNRDYLYYVLKSSWIHWKLFANSPGTTVLHLDLSGLKKLKIPRYNEGTQKIIVEKLKQIEGSISSVEQRIKSSLSLQKSLINQIF